jgi:hypothetical protein
MLTFVAMESLFLKYISREVYKKVSFIFFAFTLLCSSLLLGRAYFKDICREGCGKGLIILCDQNLVSSIRCSVGLKKLLANSRHCLHAFVPTCVAAG